MTAKATRLSVHLALLAAVPPLLADPAAADEVTLKCTFSLWNNVAVGRGWTGAMNRPPKVVESHAAVEARLARAPSQNFEITRVVDLQLGKSWRDSRSGRTLSPDEKKDHEKTDILGAYLEEHLVAHESIIIRLAFDGPNRNHELHPGHGHGLGFFQVYNIKISRLDLSAESYFTLFLGKDGRPAYIGTGGDMLEYNIRAEVRSKGSCTRVPKML